MMDLRVSLCIAGQRGEIPKLTATATAKKAMEVSIAVIQKSRATRTPKVIAVTSEAKRRHL